jgi:hypothetical protein
MRAQEWVELAAIFGLSVLTYVAAEAWLPQSISVGRLTLYLSALVLAQSLVRDLYLLSQKHKEGAEAAAGQCMCIESTVGGVGIIAGALLILLATSASISMTATVWAIAILFTTLVGFGVKDYVFGWNPWRIEKDRDHMNIIFKW